MPSSPDKTKPPSRRRPWWREPMMWLVVDDAYTRGLELSKQGQQPHAPAMSARNHAATAGSAR